VSFRSALFLSHFPLQFSAYSGRPAPRLLHDNVTLPYGWLFTYKFKFGTKTQATEHRLLMALLLKSRAVAECKELCEL
jgi:hypothetical protein